MRFSILGCQHFKLAVSISTPHSHVCHGFEGESDQRGRYPGVPAKLGNGSHSGDRAISDSGQAGRPGRGVTGARGRNSLGIPTRVPRVCMLPKQLAGLGKGGKE
eukprot:1872116-Rhodomonas_salina.2